MADRPDPGQLAETIKGLSDDELKAQINELGDEQVLQAIFDGMQEAFVPERAAGTNATIEYDIATDDDVKKWTVEIADGKCVTSPGAPADPRLALELGIVDFVRLIFGQAEGPQLFMSGKLKLRGDMMFAMQMQNYFRRDF